MQAEAQSPSGINRLPLATLLEKTTDTVVELGPEFERYRRKLADLSSRFSEGRFHLAVLGQFKRGNSTLLNALMGEPILPVGVVPLTAAPTFIQFGETPKIRVRYQDEQKENEFTGTSIGERCAYLAGFVAVKTDFVALRADLAHAVEKPNPLPYLPKIDELRVGVPVNIPRGS